jgi:alpha-amylase
VNTNAIFLTGFVCALAACGVGSDPGTDAAGGASVSPTAGGGSASSSGGATTVTAGSANGGNANGGSSGAITSAGAASAGQAGAAPLISGQPAAGSVFVHLFEWKWTDIAAECENYLGPAGFAGVQVSPPSEHRLLPSYPWYERYQTVSYSLALSRSGTAAEFADMVQRCARVGVGIYVDAVLNHTTSVTDMEAQSGNNLSSNGTRFTKYEYPNLYTATDFHQPTCAIMGTDYTMSADHVRRCELEGLADLNTGSPSVQAKIAGYLSSLVDLGVAGFRIDAGKHMAPEDIDAILTLVHQHAGAGHLPFVFLEVIDNGGEAIHASDYLAVGAASGQAVSITDFQYAGSFDRFLDYAGRTVGQFRTADPAMGNLLPSAQAVVFTTNHDTERADAIYYKDGAPYDLATVFLLAWPYGYPSLMSSFAFDRTTSAGMALGPPSDSMGHTNSIYAAGSKTPNCAPDPHNPAAGTWVCQHRDAFVAPMLAFRKASVGAETITNFWDNGKNQVGFGRGAKGFVVINDEDTALSRAFTTSLPAGDYCDVIAGGLKAGACVGATITVDATGMATIAAPARTAVVIRVGQTK